MNIYLCLTTLTMLLLLSGCSNTGNLVQKTDLLKDNSININHELFNTRDIKIISEQELFELTPEQQEDFLTFYQVKLSEGEKGHVIVKDYLVNYLHHFTYFGETYTASETIELRKGNCMSLAVLSSALAKLANVSFNFREVTTIPVFEQKNSVLLTSSHVQTRLYNPSFSNNKSIPNFLRPGITIDYFPNSKNIMGRFFTTEQFIAMYYQNIAADALVEGDLDTAFANAFAAYQHDQQSEKVLNLLAVLHRRKGDNETAEKIYVAAMNYQIDDISLMSNYTVLLEKERRFDEANQIKNKLAELKDPNPYSWLAQAYLFKAQGEFKQAITAYRKVIDLAPYVNEAYVGLYQSYMSTGLDSQAKKVLKQGLEWAYDPNVRQSIKYKLYGQTNASPKVSIEL